MEGVYGRIAVIREGGAGMSNSRADNSVIMDVYFDYL